jgi:hypothetical protein
MTNGEQKVLWHGVAAGTIVGLALGLMISLFIAMKPDWTSQDSVDTSSSSSGSFEFLRTYAS